MSRIIISQNNPGDEQVLWLQPTSNIINDLNNITGAQFTQLKGEFENTELLNNELFVCLSRLSSPNAQIILAINTLQPEEQNSLKKYGLLSGLTLDKIITETSPQIIQFTKKVFKSVNLKNKEQVNNQQQQLIEEDLSKLTPNVSTQGQVKVNQETTNTKQNPFAAVKLTQTNDFIDEDTLLDDNETYNKLGVDEGNCSTKPKACKDCSCGRKELDCGNCYLGDAFRCASCPYRGLPAFKSGDKVQLDLSKDANALLIEDQTVNIQNGKIKINFD